MTELTELTRKSLDEYEAIRDKLMEDFIQNLAPWVNWDELSGFQEQMARSIIRGLISDAYFKGKMDGISALHEELKAERNDQERAF